MISEENQSGILEGTVEDVTYLNPSNGYTVLELNAGGEIVAAVGELGKIYVGEDITLYGRFIVHPRYGTQFLADSCTRKLPDTSASILKYLSSGVIKGIGNTLAKRIVEKFGERSLDVIENEPEKLAEVKGFTRQKAEEAAREFKRVSGIRTLMIFLSEYDVQPSVAMAAWKKWGQYAVEIIRENPYVLCGDGIDLEFEAAEWIAECFGVSLESENRVRAGIIYVLSHNSLSGHTCLPYDRLKETTVNYLGVSDEIFDECLKYEQNDDNVVIYKKGERDFVYLYDYYRAESYIAGRLNVLDSFLKDSEYDYSGMIDLEERSKSIKYAEQQRKVISLALSKGFIILTGGPGTGKTTTLKAIISLYEQRGLKVQIAAPTGKAAKRISDLTGYDAKTIHRLLEAAYDSSGKPVFRHNESDPLTCDVMIVDEMSMVDTLLFESLLRALKLSCRLIMVGDSDQLPSVGAGNILKDMIDSGRLSVVKLTEIFRQAQKSAIVTNAHRIVNGEFPELTRTDSDFFFLQRLNAQYAVETIVSLCMERLPKAYGYTIAEDIQILCPSRKGMLGSAGMNKTIQYAMNPPSPEKEELNGSFCIFREDDKVMQVKNNYDVVWKRGDETGTGIFNGDIGKVVKIHKHNSGMIIDFDGRIVDYSMDMLDQLELAYAITVHKSQGSEFNAVILPLLGGYEKLYYRNLLYTAVTRAKKILIIVGSKTVVEDMVKNNRRTLRYSCFKDMIEKELGCNEPGED